MNDSKRTKKYLKLFEKHVTKDSHVLVLSEGFYCGLAAAKMGAQKVYFLDTNLLSRRVLRQFIQSNQIDNAVIIEDVDSLKQIDLEDITMVIGEPYFSSSILPWDNLYFVYLKNCIRKFLKPDVKVFPQRCIIKAVAVKFDHLHKIREPLGNCEGFSMSEFDQLILVGDQFDSKKIFQL